MSTLSLRVKYRPIRIGWCLESGNLEQFRRALRFTHSFAGGRFNPLIPVDAPELAENLLDRFRVDVLFPLEESEKISGFIKGHDYLRWPEFHKAQLFHERWEDRPPYGALVDIYHVARRIREEDIGDPYTLGHCQRLAKYATALGSHLGFDDRQLVALQRGAFLHDIGKVGIPDALLLKPGRLTPSERALMEQHTVIGDNLCRELRSLDDVRPIVRHHHERPDGTGYPDGLDGDAIPILAQIIRVVDVYDALTTRRPYKPALSPDQAFRELRAEAARDWMSQTLVEDFVTLQTGERPGGSLGLV